MRNRINKVALLILSIFLFVTSYAFANDVNPFYVRDKFNYLNTEVKSHISGINN